MTATGEPDVVAMTSESGVGGYQLAQLEEGKQTSGQVPLEVELMSEEAEAAAIEAAYDRDVRQGMWYKLVIFVMENPWPFVITLGGSMSALMWLFIAKARFANQSYGNYPLSSPNRKILETIVTDFPASNGEGSTTVYLETSQSYGIRNEDFLVALNDFCISVKSLPYVVDVSSMMTIDENKNLSQYIAYYTDPFAPQNSNFTKVLMSPLHVTDFDRLTVLQVSYSFPSSDKRLGSVIRELRHTLRNSFYVNDVRVVSTSGVAGEMAGQYDQNRDIINTLPKAIAVIVILLYVFVMILTKSIVLPVKAMIIAMLSLCSSFGFLVLVIQDGHGQHLLQFRNNLECLDPLQLIFIFVVAFGLSLDYEVFLLGRIQEVYHKTGDTKHAVARGIQSSTRSITLAAVLLCATVGSFLAAEVLLLKQIGMGIGLTIFIDATIVRAILVPAAMALMGDYNWYAPEPIKRFVEYLDIKE